MTFCSQEIYRYFCKENGFSLNLFLIFSFKIDSITLDPNPDLDLDPDPDLDPNWAKILDPDQNLMSLDHHCC